MKSTSLRIAVAGSLGAVATLCAAAAWVTQAGPKATMETNAPSQPAAAAGMVIAKDPVTGELRAPTAAEAAALAPAASISNGRAVQPRTFALKRGGVGLVVGPETESYTVVSKAPAGRLRTQCVQGDQVDAALKGSPITAVPAQEELE